MRSAAQLPKLGRILCGPFPVPAFTLRPVWILSGIRAPGIGSEARQDPLRPVWICAPGIGSEVLPEQLRTVSGILSSDPLRSSRTGHCFRNSCGCCLFSVRLRFFAHIAAQVQNNSFYLFRVYLQAQSDLL